MPSKTGIGVGGESHERIYREEKKPFAQGLENTHTHTHTHTHTNERDLLFSILVMAGSNIRPFAKGK